MTHEQKLNPKFTVTFEDGKTKTYNTRPVTHIDQLWSGMEVVFIQDEDILELWQLPTSGSVDDLYAYYKDVFDIDLNKMKQFHCTIKF